MPVDLPESESISGTEIKLTVCAVGSGVLCGNLVESKSVLKMCISKHCHKRSRVKKYLFLWDMMTYDI